MKTFRLLVVSLLIASSASFTSCKDELISEPPSSITSDTFDGTIDKIFTEYMDDFSNIKCRFALKNDTSVLLSGIKNEHLWFSEYDSSTKKLELSWEDIEETDTIQRVHIGYGEYKEVKIEYVRLRHYQETEVGNIVLFTLIGNGLTQAIFTNKDTTKRILLDKINNLYKWYDESIIINNTCYSKEGEEICNVNYMNGDELEPLSYEEGIGFNYYPSVSFKRLNIKEGKAVWVTYLEDIKIPSDAKVSYTILEKTANIWKYKVDVTLYEGAKHSYIFSVNIEDGKVNVGEEGIKVTGVTLNKSQLTLDIGETYQLVDTVKPNNAENNKVVWSSSNESVAMVDQNGFVTANSYGETKITVTTEDGGFTATANVVVKAKEISDYITSSISASIINTGGYVEGVIGCVIINNSNKDVQLTDYTVIDDNNKVVVNKSYRNNILEGNSNYLESVRVNGTFKELTLKWTYLYDGNEYTYTAKYKVTSL